MILLFTDFGLADPYVGQIHRQILQLNPGLPVVDLFHSLPAFNIKAASYLLPAYCPSIKGSAYCCVVDPGVGSEREAIFFELNGCFYVGPDNGLFEMLARRFSIKTVQRIDWCPENLSSSFHGRDLFAPVIARLLNNDKVASSPVQLTRNQDWPNDLDEIIYIDHYGNLITGRRADTIGQDSIVGLNGRLFSNAETFSADVSQSGFWYENSSGLLEIAINKGSAQEQLSANKGDVINIE